MDNLDSQVAKKSGPSTMEPDHQSPEPADATGQSAKGLRVDPVFCPADVVDPFDSVEWELRTASIKGEDGGVLFEQGNCEIPEGWSQLATNVVVS
ncbi:MAG: hypothetical protein ABIK89_17430, partial [Planctomycetota bacterium]